MSKFMGTPGPWERKNGGLTDKDGRDVFFRSVANLCSGCDESIKESEANTTLASAAPDLLDALQAFIAYNDDDGDDGVDMMVSYAKALSMARDAIDKALGEDQ